MKRLVRKWINQPSTLQPYHDLHGRRVLYDSETEEIWFTEGPVISQRMIHPEALSDGWPHADEKIEENSDCRVTESKNMREAIKWCVKEKKRLESNITAYLDDQLRNFYEKTGVVIDDVYVSFFEPSGDDSVKQYTTKAAVHIRIDEDDV